MCFVRASQDTAASCATSCFVSPHLIGQFLFWLVMSSDTRARRARRLIKSFYSLNSSWGGLLISDINQTTDWLLHGLVDENTSRYTQDHIHDRCGAAGKYSLMQAFYKLLLSRELKQILAKKKKIKMCTNRWKCKLSSLRSSKLFCKPKCLSEWFSIFWISLKTNRLLCQLGWGTSWRSVKSSEVKSWARTQICRLPSWKIQVTANQKWRGEMSVQDMDSLWEQKRQEEKTLPCWRNNGYSKERASSPFPSLLIYVSPPTAPPAQRCEHF